MAEMMMPRQLCQKIPSGTASVAVGPMLKINTIPDPIGYEQETYARMQTYRP